jgi:hypothetical protein
MLPQQPETIWVNVFLAEVVDSLPAEDDAPARANLFNTPLRIWVAGQDGFAQVSFHAVVEYAFVNAPRGRREVRLVIAGGDGQGIHHIDTDGVNAGHLLSSCATYEVPPLPLPPGDYFFYVIVGEKTCAAAPIYVREPQPKGHAQASSKRPANQ